MNRYKLTTLLALGASAIALAACGGSAEVASPGEGGFGGGGGGGGTGPGTGTGGAAVDCPTGFSNVGTISTSATAALRVCQLPGQINGNLTVPLRAGTIYSISGRTSVGTDRGVDPAAPIAGSEQGILTIEAGVRVFASSGSDYLLVNRGSQLYAEGTASNPIIFTSRQNVEGTTTATSQGQWGGIVMAGRAPSANCQLTGAVTCTGFVEGTSAFYGGNVPSDNSGRLRYVQIRYSGFEISTGNELQALTLAGVGSGTTIEYVQSFNSSDDGIEIFGGTVNLRHLVINGADDDAFDTDTGWRGGAQFGIITQRAPTATSRSAGFEWSAAPTSVPYASRYLSQPKVANFTIVGRSPAADQHTLIHLDTGAQASVLNTVVTNASGAAAGCLDIADADTAASAPVFRGVFMSCSNAYRPVNSARSQGVFTAAGNTGNTANGTSTLSAPTAGVTMTGQTLTFINGANEAGVAAVNASSVHAYFQNTTYIGAVRDASDTWWRGWTCGLTDGLSC